MILTLKEYNLLKESAYNDMFSFYNGVDYKKANVPAFFNLLFTFRQIAHDIHLTKSNYAEHKALESFYEELLELTDQLFETYQGQYGLLEGYQTHVEYDGSKDKVEIFTDYIGFVRNTAKELFEPKDTHLLNIVDEIVAVGYRTLYKLKFL
jgi:hypothetical protein